MEPSVRHNLSLSPNKVRSFDSRSLLTDEMVEVEAVSGVAGEEIATMKGCSGLVKAAGH